jgi:hypothetical protein
MRVRRVEVVDAYVEDGRAAIYSTRGMVVLLSELATTAWCLLGDGWTTSSAVTEALVAAHGDPGDGEAARLTEDALRSLAELSLLEVDDARSDGPDPA